MLGNGGGAARLAPEESFPFLRRLSRLSLPGVGGSGFEKGLAMLVSVPSLIIPTPELETAMLEAALVVRRGGAGVRLAGSIAEHSDA